MPRALITGINGQDGTLLCAELRKRGWTVVGSVRSASEACDASLDDVEILVADFRDVDRVAQLVDEASPDAVVNLAGISSVAQSWEHPVETSLVNSVAPSALLEACRIRSRRGSPTRFIQASSAEIFGAATISPQNETTPVAPVNPYGASKAHAHRLAAIFRETGVVASSAILFNHESALRPAHFVTRKISRGVAEIAAGTASVLELGDLDVRRDWSWAGDVVEALALMVEASGPGDDYVIASGRSHSVRDFVARAFAVVGIDDWVGLVRSSSTYRRPAEAAEQRGDASRIREHLGWEPRVDFDELVARMVEHDVHDIAARS